MFIAAVLVLKLVLRLKWLKNKSFINIHDTYLSEKDEVLTDILATSSAP